MEPLVRLYEDDQVVAVDKPAGLATIPERDRTRPSVLGELQRQLSERLYVVHRLDKPVSGVLLLARSVEAHRWLNGQFARRRVRKLYTAWVQGVVLPDEGTIEAALRAFGSGRMGVDPVRGKRSRTDYEVLQRRPDRTLLRLRPVTGRRHQIRVHLYHLGHPILGDPLYGRTRAGDGEAASDRLLLHACEIGFERPDGQIRRILSPLPPAFSC